MKTKNATFSLPIDLLKGLRTVSGRRKISSFVSAAIQEKMDREIEALKAGYIAENNDPASQEIISDWSSVG